MEDATLTSKGQLISALNLGHGCTSTVTRDRKAAKLAGMTLLQ